MYVQFVQCKHIRDTIIFFTVIEGIGNVIDVDSVVVPHIHNAQTNDTIESQ